MADGLEPHSDRDERRHQLREPAHAARADALVLAQRTVSQLAGVLLLNSARAKQRRKWARPFRMFALPAAQAECVGHVRGPHHMQSNVGTTDGSMIKHRAATHQRARRQSKEGVQYGYYQSTQMGSKT
jgi:hypothetical protein